MFILYFTVAHTYTELQEIQKDVIIFGITRLVHVFMRQIAKEIVLRMALIVPLHMVPMI